MGEISPSSRSGTAAREKQLEHVLNLALEKLRDCVYCSVFGVPRVRLPNGVNCRVDEKPTKDWLTDLGHGQGLIVRPIELSWLVSILSNRAREKTLREGAPREVLEALEREPLFQVIEDVMQTRKSITEAIGKLHERLTGRARKLGIDTQRHPRWPKSPTALSRYLRARPDLLAAIGVEARDWHDTNTAMEVTLSKVAPPDDAPMKNASPSASPRKASDSNRLPPGDAVGNNKDEIIARLQERKRKE